jgi:hypothetical protein
MRPLRAPPGRLIGLLLLASFVVALKRARIGRAAPLATCCNVLQRTTQVADGGGRWSNCTAGTWTLPPSATSKRLNNFDGGACSVRYALSCFETIAAAHVISSSVSACVCAECRCVCVHAHARVCACVRVSVRACVRVSVHSGVRVYVQLCMRAHACACVCVRACVCACVHMCACVCARAHVCVCQVMAAHFSTIIVVGDSISRHVYQGCAQSIAQFSVRLSELTIARQCQCWAGLVLCAGWLQP